MLKLNGTQFQYLFETGMITKFGIYGVAKLAQVHVTQKELYNEEGEVLWFDDEHYLIIVFK